MFTSEKINENITRILCPGNVYAYVVEGNEKALLVDTGLGIYDLKGYVESITSKPVDVVLTHGHVDHAGGSVQFENVYLSPLDYELVKEHTEKEIRKGYLIQNGVDVKDEDMLEKKDVSTYLPLLLEQTFDLGGRTVMACPMPGHTQGSMAILVNPDRVILFGDACNSGAFMQFENCLSIHDYRIALEQFKEKYEALYDTVLYSHPHNFGSKIILNEMINLCFEIENGLVKEIPFTPGTLVAKEIDPKTFKRLDGKIANIVYVKSNIK